MFETRSSRSRHSVSPVCWSSPPSRSLAASPIRSFAGPMRLLLTSEARFERLPDGTIWAPAAYGCALWRRYLEVFSAVLVAARVADVQRPSSGSVIASAPGIDFCALPPYCGLAGLVRHVHSIQVTLAAALAECPAMIVRCPSPIGYLTAETARTSRRPYGAEIVGDPHQVFAVGAFRHPLRAPIR